METLTEIANRNTCDKGTQWYDCHGYTLEYEKYIPCCEAFNLLEIGIWHADSLRMWQQYNPLAKIWAIDIDPASLSYITDRTNLRVFIGSQTDHVVLSRAVREAGSFKIIIDDGSHNTRDIIRTADFMLPHITADGYYFVEDLHAQQAAGAIPLLLKIAKDYKVTMLCDNKLMMIQK